MRDLVEEDVLEVGVLEARDVLWVRAHRGNGGGDSRQGLERVDELLAAGLEADVDERGAPGDDGGEDVAEHGAVGLADGGPPPRSHRGTRTRQCRIRG
jgi:hypothetical protein